MIFIDFGFPLTNVLVSIASLSPPNMSEVGSHEPPLPPGRVHKQHRGDDDVENLKSVAEKLALTLFAELDGDRDNSLCLDEIKNLFSDSTSHNILKSLDRDNDGVLNKLEWIEYIHTIGIEDGYQKAIDALGAALDDLV